MSSHNICFSGKKEIIKKIVIIIKNNNKMGIPDNYFLTSP